MQLYIILKRNKMNNKNFYSIAEVEDYGEYWKVISVFNNEVKDLVGTETVNLNNIAAQVIERSLDNGKLVRIKKSTVYKEALIKDLIIIEKNEIDELELYKGQYKTKARRHINHFMANIHGIQLFEFYDANNKLCSKGYFVHEDNREEVYLQILETGDEDLINDLEIYLNAYDILHRQTVLEKLYKKLYNDLNFAKTKEECDIIFNDFKKEYDRVVLDCRSLEKSN